MTNRYHDFDDIDFMKDDIDSDDMDINYFSAGELTDPELQQALSTQDAIVVPSQEAPIDAIVEPTPESNVTPALAQHVIDNMNFVLCAEVGNLSVSINDLLNLKVGEQLNFNTNLQEVKLKVNSVLIGFGEIVNINGKYGIKVTKILNTQERLQY